MATVRHPKELARVSQEKATNRVIGYGPSFPFSFSDKGQVRPVVVASGLAKINQAIHSILLTRKGERVYRPTFGSNLYKLVFEPNDEFLGQQLKYEVADALRAWERRIKLLRVEPISKNEISFDTLIDSGHNYDTIAQLRDPNSIGIYIEYVVVKTHQIGNYVYPFVVETAEGPLNLGMRGPDGQV